MRALVGLLLLYVLVPGSGRLAWDGLPLSTRAEFGLFVVLLITFLSSDIRDFVRQWFQSFRWSGLVKPLLLLLCVIKFLTFAWAPMSAGFEACYQSLYFPPQNVTDWRGSDLQVCEKSYEGPFLPRGGTGSANTSRVDSVIDFGKRPYDWSLPFMNDYPRLGNLWLTRFPFSATYSATVPSTDDDAALPIYSIGEVEVIVDGKSAVQVSNYDRFTLSVVPLARGKSEVLIRYRYRDDSASVPPDIPPEPKGPYAALKVGEPRPVTEVLENSTILVTGVSVRGSRFTDENITEVRDASRSEITWTNLNQTRRRQEDELLRSFDLEIEIPAKARFKFPIEIVAEIEEKSVILGTLSADTDSPLNVRVNQSPEARMAIQLDAVVTTDRDSLIAFRPDTRAAPNLLLRVLLAGLDFFSLFIFAILALAIGKTAGRVLVPTLALALIAWLLIEPLDAILPTSLGGGRELVIPYAAIAALILAARRKVSQFPLVFLLPISTVMATQKIFEHLYFNHPGAEVDWWGKLVFLWRDSDWFANHGNARATFVEGSLRGGESIFWFRAAPRYLIMLLHLILGENDVLIGLVSLTVGFMLACYLAVRFVIRMNSTTELFVGWFSLFSLLVFLGDQITTAFAFFVSSEYPTWLIFLAFASFLLRNEPEPRIWITTAFAFGLAATVHFRPNGLFVAFALFPILIVAIWRVSRTAKPIDSFKQIGWAISAFFVTLPLGLIHNLYYGQKFLISQNPTNMLAVRFGEIFREEGFIELVKTVWVQLCGVMYWRIPHDPNFAIFFWGSQLILVAAITARFRRQVFNRTQTLMALIPLTYVLPMLPFKLDSYYPRLLVTGSLLCLCIGLLIWPKSITQRAE